MRFAIRERKFLTTIALAVATAALAGLLWREPAIAGPAPLAGGAIFCVMLVSVF
jgi:hypothetical protein